jgi:hypothetical protein
VKGVDRKTVTLLPAEKQASPVRCKMPGELREAADALLRAKRTLVEEKRFFCCIRGGCGQCAHEADCPCGADLAAGRGVCGDCMDGWRSGRGSFIGIPLSDVTLAPVDAHADMGPAAPSGTSQAPAAAPMDMLAKRLGAWKLMLHGVLFAVYSDQTGPRGRDKIFSTNWLMLSGSRRLGPGTLMLRSMLSLEPATVTRRRYPLLFQGGETAFGVPIISGQHPHDFFMELAANYQLRLGERTSFHVYGGPRGEPALGPPAYPHRPSASENPVATLSHHFQDSTHIASNVVTAGITYGRVTGEVSGFHGREPGEHRWRLDTGGIDSLAARLTVHPTPRWTAQFSLGRINNREATHPLRDSLRQTASVMYIRPMASGHWATSLVWGRNHDLTYTQLPGPPPTLFAAGIRPQHVVVVPTRIPGQIYNSFLAESTLLFRKRNWIWTRIESTDKDSLLLFQEAPFVLLVDEQRFTRVQAFTAGYERDLPFPGSWLNVGAGGQLTVFRAPANLAPVYGSHPVGAQLFLRLRLVEPRKPLP